MTSTCFAHRYRIFTWHLLVFPIDIVFLYDINGFSYIYILRHQWFCPYKSYFYMTSMVFPIDIVFDMTSTVFPIYIVFLYDIYLFLHIYIEFLYDINGFPHRYRIFIWHQWFTPHISDKTSMAFHRDIGFLYDINGFAHRYRIFLGHLWFFT